jgi:hypothetical protein
MARPADHAAAKAGRPKRARAAGDVALVVRQVGGRDGMPAEWSAASAAPNNCGTRSGCPHGSATAASLFSPSATIIESPVRRRTPGLLEVDARLGQLNRGEFRARSVSVGSAVWDTAYN